MNNHLLAPVERLVSSVLEDDTMDDGERELGIFDILLIHLTRKIICDP